MSSTLRKASRPIFVAATRQHVGKTSVSLALTAGLQKRFDKVGFLKPVGQQHLEVASEETGETIRVDKDVKLVREHFNLDHLDYSWMSPVIIPPGYTRDYIDGVVDKEEQMDSIRKAYEKQAAVCDMMLLEGTGHIGVGSCVAANNAQVASMTGCDMVLVANGGLGSAFDDLNLNYTLCREHGVRVAGVVINKVLPEKYEQTKKYMSALLRDNWKVPLLGCVPDKPFLGCPALADLERLFSTKLLAGEAHRMRHYNVTEINLVTTSLGRFLENLRVKPTRTMYVTHVTRNDIILGYLGEYQRKVAEGKEFEAALVLCGRKPRYDIFPEIKDMIRSLDAPVLHVSRSTYKAMEAIQFFTPKLNIDDTSRIESAVGHYEPFIDFDELLRRTTAVSNSSFDEPNERDVGHKRRW
mmetsp:Transcript_13743/g.27408  ORF Transcript_13743/g.27408 Transcript_13743/m.27408 type:complete len:411 (-) Transcript_13743:782-2014(-)